MNIFISAGEASGDTHAAGVVRELKQRYPDATFFGIGGDRMLEAGVELIEHAGRMSFMGFAEVVRHLPFIYATRTKVLKEIVVRKPDLILLIDYPGFHFSLLRCLKRMRFIGRFGLPKVLYYIPPQVWAWKAGRAKELAQLADRIAVIFPFEVEIFAQHGGHATFVGHPLLDEVGEIPPRGKFLKSIGLEPDDRVIGIFPGSRKQEIRRHLPILVETVRLLRRFHPEVKIILAEAPGVPLDLYTRLLRDIAGIVRVAGVSHEVLAHANASIVKSGSSTIEAAYFGNPFVVFYKVSSLSYAIGKRVVKVPFIAMANILADEMVVKELIQDQVTAENLFAEMLPFLNLPDKVEACRAGLRKVRARLGEPGAARRVAELAAELLEEGMN
jgi:lipid-A-disaccharide synthase